MPKDTNLENNFLRTSQRIRILREDMKRFEVSTLALTAATPLTKSTVYNILNEPSAEDLDLLEGALEKILSGKKDRISQMAEGLKTRFIEKV